jgi:sugar diacid utilization regulator
MKYFPELEEERWQSMAAVPIPARSGEVIGVVVLHTAAPREFTEEDVELLRHTATLVGGAIADAQLYEDARERVAALTRLADVSQRLAAATTLDGIHEAATAGARALLHVEVCQLWRFDGGGDQLRLAASDPPGLPMPRAGAGSLLTTPLAASDGQLGMLVVLRQQRFAAGDEELLRALADQIAMGIERAELIARLTARDRLKDMFDALAGNAPDGAVTTAAPAGCDLSRPHVLVHGQTASATSAEWEVVADRLEASMHALDRSCFIDVALDGLRAVVLLREGEPHEAVAAAERVAAACDAVARDARIVLGVSAPSRCIAESRQALREATRAAQIAGTLSPEGGAMSYEQLGAYKYLAHLQVHDQPRDRHRTAVEALLDHDRRRRSALLDTLEEYLARRRSVADTARTLYIHPNTLRQRLGRIERVTGLRLESEDLLALELAVKLVRLDDARRRAP